VHKEIVIILILSNYILCAVFGKTDTDVDGAINVICVTVIMTLMYTF